MNIDFCPQCHTREITSRIINDDDEFVLLEFKCKICSMVWKEDMERIKISLFKNHGQI